MSRPRIEFTDDDWSKLDQLAGIQCTGEEMAGVMGCSFDTIEKRIREKYDQGFTEWYKEHSAGGKMSLRRFQYEACKRGNSALLIWLGKQYLGQTEKIVQQIGNIKDEKLIIDLSGNIEE